MKNNLMLVLCLTMFACHRSGKNNIETNNSINNPSINWDTNSIDYYKHLVEQKIDIKPIDTSTTEIRVWIYGNLLSPEELWIFKPDNESLRFNSYKIIRKDENNNLVGKDNSIAQVIKKSNYEKLPIQSKQLSDKDNSLLKKLDSFAIEKIQPQINVTPELKQKGGIIDGGLYYYIEIKNKNQRNSIFYFSPEYFASKEENNAKVWSFIKFLRTLINNN
ncbi:MAG: hypothetical protein JST86_00160 [Bacteroidetes bacterium]|nr:hypothetical protein [Bacteroidota bacterium]